MAIDSGSSDEDEDMTEDETFDAPMDENHHTIQRLSIVPNSGTAKLPPGVDVKMADQPHRSQLDVLGSADSRISRKINEAHPPTEQKPQQTPEIPDHLVRLGSEHPPTKREDHAMSRFLAAAQQGDVLEIRRGLRQCLSAVTHIWIGTV